MFTGGAADILPVPLLEGATRIVGPDTVEVARGAWIRNRRRTRAWASIAVLWSVVFACTVFIPGSSHVPKPLGDYLALGAFYFGIAAVGIAFAGRVANAGVWIGPDGVVVRGPFRTHSVSIADAEVFVPGLQGGAGNGTPCPTLTRTHGRPVGVWALGRRNFVFRYQRLFQEIQPLCDELNALLRSLQSGLASTEPTAPRTSR
jgi:hypothetical protein